LAERSGERLLIMKGAPEDVIALCELAPDLRAALQAKVTAMGEDGQRLLAVASRRLDHDRLDRTDEAALSFEGFIAFLDPPKASAGAALARLEAGGVAIKILTGDCQEVASHVLEALGFKIKGVLDGHAIDGLREEALMRRVRRVNLFCRVNPAQKLRIILALKRQGQTVGFLGDGVNDAPALHAADVGLSVDSAVDVAKAAAPIVLLDKDLGVLAAGVLEGRRTVLNVDKYVLMASSANFGNILSMALAGAFLPFLPLLPIQVLLTNLIYDLAQTGLPFDRVDDEAVRGPIHWDIRRIERFMLMMGPVSTLFDLMTFFVLIALFHAGMAFFRTGWFVESLITQILMIFAVRTRRSLFKSRPHPAVVVLAFGLSALTLILPLTPLGGWFQLRPPPLPYYGFLALAALAFLAAMEGAKRLFYSRLVPKAR
jgi:Mg2+-importing ATPase